ncbi:hypothetical protein [Desulfovibrio ferrophilus]|uniref:Uncharacterized protein n=1 Tax=Desulfovibrio ferrophilus TaxID=241368 RepID=A0A2Z6B3N2_9BACT|nr:hypothetical protein [Desulfovibrio ferrophilus]BBD10134.1 uncharacterized protein DFE_A0033 [Desulfovibrio ferrophilus]
METIIEIDQYELTLGERAALFEICLAEQDRMKELYEGKGYAAHLESKYIVNVNSTLYRTILALAEKTLLILCDVDETKVRVYVTMSGTWLYKFKWPALETAKHNLKYLPANSM